MGKKNRIPHKFQPWIDARKKFQLTHAHVQMARELGMNPKRFSSQTKKENETWKLPLPEFIEALYEKKYGKRSPDIVKTMEELAAEHLARRAAKKEMKAKLQSAAEEEGAVEGQVEPSEPDGIDD